MRIRSKSLSLIFTFSRTSGAALIIVECCQFITRTGLHPGDGRRVNALFSHRLAARDFDVVASSFERANPDDTSLFFVSIDYDHGSDVFAKVCVLRGTISPRVGSSMDRSVTVQVIRHSFFMSTSSKLQRNLAPLLCS